MPPTTTLVVADAGQGHWSAVAWTPRYGAVLCGTFRDRTDETDPPTIADLRTFKPWDSEFYAREIGFVYARNGQEGWRLYRDAYRARHPRRKAA